ncbi:hypothetical protein [Burkholderia gladioli]|uniref:hypothetical protein n=1 Tax=Burkholderia gladioli TaxID=28095 RepID=UPI0034DABD25
MANPNIPSDYFLQGLLADPCRAKLYQIVAPDGRIIVNFLPHAAAWQIAQMLPYHCGGTRFTFQEVPAEQLGVIA